MRRGDEKAMEGDVKGDERDPYIFAHRPHRPLSPVIAPQFNTLLTVTQRSRHQRLSGSLAVRLESLTPDEALWMNMPSPT